MRVSIPCSSGRSLQPMATSHHVRQQCIPCFNPLFIGAQPATGVSHVARRPECLRRFQSPVHRGAACNLFRSRSIRVTPILVSIPCSSGRSLQHKHLAKECMNLMTHVSIPCSSGRSLQRGDVIEYHANARAGFQSPVHRGAACNHRSYYVTDAYTVSVSIPCSSGRSLQQNEEYETPSEVGFRVSIPCSSGRSLQLAQRDVCAENPQRVSIPCSSGRSLQRGIKC